MTEPRTIVEFSDTSEVTFKDLSEDDIESYLATGEYTDKAGAYAIQGEGRKLVEKFTGSYLNIVGLPLEKLQRVLQEKNWHVGQKKS